jgi:xylulose-5-phosphate/fructose-6-phosphate phosphoketolase
MIVLRSPKGAGPLPEIEGHFLEGFWRAHQVPLPAAKKDPEQLRALEHWMHSLRPDPLFDSDGKLASVFRELAPTGDRRMSANPHANGGRLKKALRLPDFREFAANVDKPGRAQVENTRPLGSFLAEVMKRNASNFRVFGPDETSSNKLDALFTVTKKFWIEERFPEDQDGGNLAPDGRVMEMLSEHTIEGMLEGYLLTGRHGLFSCYEAFIHIIDSMFNQHAKWLKVCNHLTWRRRSHP